MNFRDRFLKAISIIATWSFNFFIAVLKISVEILVSVFVVLGTLIAMSSSGQSDDDDEDEFISKHSNGIGGVKIDNKSYSESQARYDYQSGKFWDK